MGKMGGSKDKNDFSALLGKKPGPVLDTVEKAELTGLKEKREFQKGVRLTGTENDKFELLKTALGTDQDAKALLRCFEFVWEKCGKDIEEIAAKKEKMKVL